MLTLRPEDHFVCSVCLELFSDPVSTPCGHNFCKACLSHHWELKTSWTCPVCNQAFSVRPELQTNTLLCAVMRQFRDEAPRQTEHRRTGEVFCDVCPEPKAKAVKSCLDCSASYCDAHLEPHWMIKGLKTHQLSDPLQNLEDRLCPKHDRPLELFCLSDHACICVICPVLDHQNHQFVSLKQEFDRRKASLSQTDTENLQNIEQRRRKIQEIRQSLNLSRKAADREVAEGTSAFNSLIKFAEKSRDTFIEEVRERQKETKKKAEDLIQELEEEISELQNKSDEIEELTKADDYVKFMKRSLKLNTILKDWTEFNFEPPSYEGTAARAMSQLENMLNEEFKKFFKSELKRVRQCAVDVTLDPDTANPYLVISENLKQVYDGELEKKLPDSSERFSVCRCVFGKQSFTSGRFYFEAQVEGKSKWDVGVARKSANRKGKIMLCPQNGFWAVGLRDGAYKACGATQNCFRVKSESLRKVGVFVDYEEGLVMFYDADTAALVHSFTNCVFGGKIVPYFGPCFRDGGRNAAPITICGGLKGGLFYRFRFQQMD